MRTRVKTSGRSILALLLIAIPILAFGACAGPSGAQGPAGVGVTGATIDSAGHLEITLSSGQTIDAGNVVVTQTATQSTGPTITMADLFTLLQPVIVRIDVAAPGLEVSGSGVIIRSDGYIITNEHVIDGATSIKITLNNDQQFPATVTSSDANIDLAILKMGGGFSNLSVAELGSAGDMGVGVVVVAGGYPLGPALPGPASFSQGIISAIRTLNGQRYIQTDVAINPGNSGGALVTRNSAKVIGITTARVLPPGESVVGIGLAIPIDVIQAFIQNSLK